MTIAASTTMQLAETITIADHVPAEVRDGGKVRIGAAIHIDWIAWEIMHRLLQILAGSGG